ncbi:MAG: HAD hydrolase family protein [Bacillus sp. (in: Bacteria)]|nr:HAD hydrolase family protein [Bacillus sp. (in: firmicutes)]MCM1426371.1 HAD hydrolase family protein [Eubacterium sp.]
MLKDKMENGLAIKHREIPRIGMRIIKSGIAVALCFVVAYFRRGNGIVFYSLLSALWCMQGYRKNTKKNALQRMSGTVIGAVYGLVFLLLMQRFGALNTGQAVYEGKVFFHEAAAVSFFIIVVLYTTVLLGQKQASYFSCVVFLSIAVNHMADANPYIFVWNRFLDTCIGIFIGVFVNDFSLPIKKKKDILFVSGLDDTLLNKNCNLTDYTRVELNRMLEEGLQFTVSTVRTPASLMEPVRDIQIKLPVIAMDGAVLYDMQEKMYRKVYVMSAATSQKILSIIRDAEVNCFINVIVDDMLVIYYADCDDKVYNELVATLRKSPFRNYVKRELPEYEEVVYFMMLDKEQSIERLYRLLQENGFESELKIVKYAARDYPGYAYMKIYNKNASKQNMMEYLKEMTGLKPTITFGTIPGCYDVTVKEGDVNRVVHVVKRYFEYGIKP